jgi:1-acyl-sn-glycerol-3-phosphate acyltransferase
MFSPAQTDLLALFLCAALVALAAVAFILWWRRSNLSFCQTLLWIVNFLIARLVWRTHVEGQLPTDRGAVIVANHRSSVDPSFLQVCTRRVVYWMVAREYCEAPVIGWLLRQFQVIPVGRGGVDTAATKQAIRLAQEGGLIGMFPEGRINLTDDQLLLAGRPGAALVALRARVPIIPVYIADSPYDGTSLGPLFMRARVRVKIGRLIDLAPYYGREKEEGVTKEITKRALAEIAKLAGHSDFVPQLAPARWKPNGDELPANSNNHQNGQPVATRKPLIAQQ